MSDNQNTTQNKDFEENSIPVSPQEPTADAPIPPMDSESSEALPEAPEALREGFSDESNNIPPSNSTPTEAVNEPKPEEKSAPNEPSPEPVSEPTKAPEPETAQIPVNEPLENENKTSNEQAKPVREQPKSNLTHELLIIARNAIQFRKRKKLDRVMSLFLKQSKITKLEKENKIKQVGKTGKGVSYSRI